MEQLSLGPTTVSDLARPYQMSQPAISKHLKLLEQAALVSRDPLNRQGPWRLELAAFTKSAEWMDAYARIWAARLRAFSKPHGPEKGTPARRHP